MATIESGDAAHHAARDIPLSLPPARYREQLLTAETPVSNCLQIGEAYG
jgi:hypothetical protein